MIPNTDFALVSALDLDPIKTKLMHAASGEGWSLEHANAVETEYRRFLYLMKAFPSEQIAPTRDVDTFWHYHILDTMKYARDCEQAFGYFMHHYPYLGLAGDNGVEMQQQAGERMRELYESTFGVSYERLSGADGALEADEVQMACDLATRQAANSAWCFGPGSVKAAGTETAWCFGPGIVKAADIETAWCIGTGNVKATGVETAWCFGPGIGKATAIRTTSYTDAGTLQAS